MERKPLGVKAYGHIPHLPGSRMGPGDHACEPGQATICTERLRDNRDRIIVTEKLDGSCCAIAKVEGVVVPLGRAGYVASTSKYEQHQIFHRWALARAHIWSALLNDGERIVGEWLAQAHGTIYKTLPEGPFVAFDIFSPDNDRIPWDVFLNRCDGQVPTVPEIHRGGPLKIASVLESITASRYGETSDPVEGAVWRLERDGEFEFMAKWVRPDKQDGKYLPQVTGAEPIWNWRPATISE